ncbi:MAG TPA: hypothetical protein VGF52_00215, partial [Tepidisphaeraceae bacterium]
SAMAQTTQPSSQQRIDQQAAELPQVKVDSIQQLVKFSVDENMLAARTPLISIGGQTHVIVPDLPGVVRLTLLARRGAEPNGRDFMLQDDLSDPAGGDVSTMISAIAGRFILSRDSEQDDRISSVQLVQDPPLPPGVMLQQEPVRLLISRSDATGVRKSIKLTLNGQNFWDLRLRHSREVDQYLRPIIREFHQESAVFAIAPAVAWQVLGTGYTPDQKMIDRVNTLLAQLDVDDFRARESAMKQLKSLGEPAAIVLGKTDRQKLSPQQSSAIDSFLADFERLKPQEVSQLAEQKSFLLDVLFDDDANLRRLALGRLEKIAGRKIELGNDAQAIEKLRGELLPTTQP